jgi:hypothetical protein
MDGTLPDSGAFHNVRAGKRGMEGWGLRRRAFGRLEYLDRMSILFPDTRAT